MHYSPIVKKQVLLTQLAQAFADFDSAVSLHFAMTRALGDEVEDEDFNLDLEVALSKLRIEMLINARCAEAKNQTTVAFADLRTDLYVQERIVDRAWNRFTWGAMRYLECRSGQHSRTLHDDCPPPRFTTTPM